MNSTKKEVISKEKEIEYPVLMKSKYSDFVILLVTPKVGTVVWSNDYSYEVGYWSSSWIKDSFDYYDGKILLEN